ncbi:Mitochondrial import inner membrane translocase subunit TIM50 [Aphelenchoides besseyi]|nr:Mitochondrial import inner membrane translocase subunit TIM50 [Aphelenchoides besseyi]KAI6210201.1 Mitochondrial import inner membrane translocase subunit TIM50 [Aphelenchoides besseyi]
MPHYVIQSAVGVSTKLLTTRLLLAPVVNVQRCYASDSSSSDYIVDRFSPKIRSPFDNPRRVYRAPASNETFRLTQTSQFADDRVNKENNETISSIKSDEVVDSGLPKESEETIFQKPSPPIDESTDKTLGEEVHASAAATAASTSKPTGTRFAFLDRWGLGRIDKDLPEDEKRKQRIARTTKLGNLFLAIGTAAGLIWFCIHYGRQKRDENGVLIPDPYAGSMLAPFYRITDGFRTWLNYAIEPSREQLLPDPLKPPYVQPKYTLVIEMKNVLVAPEWTYKTGYRFKKRPALEYFLDVVGYPNFELVIYTSEPPMSAYSVVDHIDPKQRIMYRLFRDCTKYMDGHHVKDLNRLNRDLSKVIFIDFDASSAKLNTENVLRVPKWDGDMNDTSLVDLAELLKTIHLSDVEDVRPTLQYYSGFDNPSAEFRRRAQLLAEQQNKQKEQQEQGLWRKYGGSLFGFQRHRTV